MSNYTSASLLLPIVIFFLVAMATRLPEKVGYTAGRLVQVVRNFRKAHHRNARPVQVVSPSNLDESQVPTAMQKIDWSHYESPACMRSKDTFVLLFNT